MSEFKPFNPTKPRRPFTTPHVLTRGVNEVGGLAVAADLIQRNERWLYTAADPDVERRREAKLSYEDARTLSRAGASAFAEDLSLLAGGVFLPPLPETAPHALQMAVASYASESGEALAEIIRRAADGEFSQIDAQASLKEIDDAMRALMGVRAIVAAGALDAANQNQNSEVAA